MILALDTDVLVGWAVSGAATHLKCRKLLRSHIGQRGRIGLVPQVLFEFVHISTDPKRLKDPLTMDQALALTEQLWNSREAEWLFPGPRILPRTVELMHSLHLGRKRILDTALAATLEEAGVARLATFNRKDFQCFPFLVTVSP